MCQWRFMLPSAMSDLIGRVPRSGCLHRPPRPRPAQTEAPEAAQAELVICDYTIERSFAWAARFRRLARDYERLPETLAGLHFVAFSILMLTRAMSLFTSP
jgi:transposase